MTLLRQGWCLTLLMLLLVMLCCCSCCVLCKSRNSRNRATYDTEVWEEALQLYQSRLKQSSLTKRGEGPQLSVVSPLDVLRQQLIYELARRRIKENREQIKVNEHILKTIGKRSIEPPPSTRLDDRPAPSVPIFQRLPSICCLHADDQRRR